MDPQKFCRGARVYGGVLARGFRTHKFEPPVWQNPKFLRNAMVTRSLLARVTPRPCADSWCATPRSWMGYEPLCDGEDQYSIPLHDLVTPDSEKLRRLRAVLVLVLHDPAACLPKLPPLLSLRLLNQALRKLSVRGPYASLETKMLGRTALATAGSRSAASVQLNGSLLSWPKHCGLQRNTSFCSHIRTFLL